MTSFRGLRRPPAECAARSSGPRYASTSTRRPHSDRPPTSRTTTLPSRSRATTVGSRSKKLASRILPGGRESERTSDSRFTQLLASGLPAALVRVKGFVRHLVHRVPVHARVPGGDAYAEGDRDGHLLRAVDLLERLAHPDAHLSRVVLVRFWHRHAELIAAQPAASVGRAYRALQLLREQPDRLVPDVVTLRVVDLLEVVEVDHHQREPSLVPLRGRNRAVDRALELGAVGEPGQVVGPC